MKESHRFGRIRAADPPGKFHRWVIVLLSLPLIVFIALPLAALILRTSPSQLIGMLATRTVADAVLLSIETSAATVVLTAFLGTPVAYLIAKYRFAGRELAETVMDLPIVLPPAVAGVALLMAFGRSGIAGRWLALAGWTIPFTTVAVIFAQMFVAAPFYVKSAVQGFRAVNAEYEQSAALDGASSWQIFRSVTLPLSRTFLAGGILMTWARSLGEFGATIIFAGNFPGRTQTMPLAIYLGFEIDFSTAVALAIVLLAISAGIMIVLRMVLRKTSVVIDR
ncbi:MAG TPA: ABC transporter permease [Bacteroidota bacterium]|nr:ABC transporter permease [Bacteroidota bacterium]